ncbi:protein of unknown function [Pararobbsia alpina]
MAGDQPVSRAVCEWAQGYYEMRSGDTDPHCRLNPLIRKTRKPQIHSHALLIARGLRIGFIPRRTV